MVGSTSGARYSVSILRQVERTFAQVTAEPVSLYLDCGQLGVDLREGPIPLYQLRDLLLRPETPLAARDAVWRELIDRARPKGSTWRVMAVAMAMPGLRHSVRVLSLDFHGDRFDLESEIVRGFLEALAKVDVADSALCARLVRAAQKAGTKLVYAEAAFEGARWSAFRSRAPLPPWGHPDFLLLDAVAAGVISLEEAKLIATTRLEHVPVDQVAAWFGERTNTVVVRRHRAEHRVRDAIVEGTVSSADSSALADPPGPRPRRARTGEPCEAVLERVSPPGGNRGLTQRPLPVVGSPGQPG